MAGLVPPAGPKPLLRGKGPAIHVLAKARKTWMPGSSPGMTAEIASGMVPALKFERPPCA